MRIRVAAASLAAVAAVGVLAGCSSSSDDVSSAPAASATAAAPSGEASGAAAGSPEMAALCQQMVDEKLSPEDATALAESNGYVARVGTIDGEGQAVTMDFREDRFTFDVEGGVVVGCTYG